MSSFLLRVFNDGTSDMRNKTLGMYGLLLGLNLFAWAWALAAFHGNAAMLGSCLLAYSFGLRHAFDADHIAAIDNVTRKLMQEGKRPVSVGFFFSLGHSMVVVLLAIGIAVTAAALAEPVRAAQGSRRDRRHGGFGAVPVRHRRSPTFWC